MTTIDELGRKAASAARADAARLAASRLDSGLERLRLNDGPIVSTARRGRDPRRLLALGIAAALAAAAAIALVVNVNDAETTRVVPAEQPTQPSPSSTAVATTVAAETTDAPTTNAPAVDVSAGVIAVSHDELPPAFPATVLVGITDQTKAPLVAIGDTRIVTVDRAGSTAMLIDPYDPPSVPPQPVQLDVATTDSVAAGPGDVLYAVVQGDGIDMSLDAIALSGDRAGQVIASAPVPAVEFAEAPTAVLGHGAAGIIDRRTGKTLLGYVDLTGAPITLGRPGHQVVADGDLSTGDVNLKDSDGTHDWHLTINRDSSFDASPTVGGSPPAPSSHGGAVAWTSVGQDEAVVAVLAADGTGTWYSLADGWHVAASDLDGTILVRLNGSTVELARLDPPQRIDFLDQPAAPNQRIAFATTLPTSLTTADPCTIDNLEIVPTEEGAMGTSYGILNLRNKGSAPCAISGVPDVELLDAAGNVVQSTDPSLVAQSGGQSIVLVTDSWATSLLGAIANNVCGGNESSQLRFTVGGKTSSIPFAVGRPVDPQQCIPSEIHDPVAGALAVEAFAPVQLHESSTSPLADLQIGIEADPTVKAGEILHYDVVITATDTPFVVDQGNCPIYTETLGTASAQLLLNCNSSNAILIGARESVRFHIELPIPADASLGATTLTWTPIEPTGTPVTSSVTIVA